MDTRDELHRLVDQLQSCYLRSSIHGSSLLKSKSFTSGQLNTESEWKSSSGKPESQTPSQDVAQSVAWAADDSCRSGKIAAYSQATHSTIGTGKRQSSRQCATIPNNSRADGASRCVGRRHSIAD